MLIFATRPSALARWQTDHIIELLQAAWPELNCHTEIFTTKGDRILDKPLPEIGGKGLFTSELEEALLAGRVSAAVHSLKDLPTEATPGLIIGTIPARADARDAWICPAGHTLATLPKGATVGTSSTRRRAQLLARRPDLDLQPIRGNVDTRLRKVQEGQYDALVLAAAGLARLGLQTHITSYLSFEEMLPAPGQAALAVQCRADDKKTLEILHVLEHTPTRQAVTTERAFLDSLGGGCSLPVGAYATLTGNTITLRGVVASPDGSQVLFLRGQGTDPAQIGHSLAVQALAQGAREMIDLIG
ncbi:MAG TPA: hydroxymethylbilane synthase [Anaerolineales bacterium]|nr:hydroxymethylbilane synthase [Anaerolineales bacterium]